MIGHFLCDEVIPCKVSFYDIVSFGNRPSPTPLATDIFTQVSVWAAQRQWSGKSQREEVLEHVPENRGYYTEKPTGVQDDAFDSLFMSIEAELTKSKGD